MPGSNQRKGCLWAMNPAKVNKMDEEVQKWSRKDPMAIKKGMLLPRKLLRLPALADDNCKAQKLPLDG